MKIIVLILLNVLFTSAGQAGIKYMESEIIDFEGCDWDKIINLKNGYVWECSEYGYTYHYGVVTVLQVNGKTMLCVGNLEEAIEEYPNGHCYEGILRQLR